MRKVTEITKIIYFYIIKIIDDLIETIDLIKTKF